MILGQVMFSYVTIQVHYSELKRRTVFCQRIFYMLHFVDLTIFGLLFFVSVELKINNEKIQEIVG